MKRKNETGIVVSRRWFTQNSKHAAASPERCPSETDLLEHTGLQFMYDVDYSNNVTVSGSYKQRGRKTELSTDYI